MATEISPEAIDLASVVRGGDTVLWSQGPSEPLSLTQPLVEQRRQIGRFRAFLGSSYGQTFAPEHSDYIDFLGIGAVGATRKIMQAGALRVIPCHLSQLGTLMRQGELRIDVVLVQLSRDQSGTFSYGSVCSYLPDAIRNARVVVAEVNEQAPWTFCQEAIDPERIDYVVQVSTPLFDVPSRESRSVDVAIAKEVAALVEDGAILQIGIGTLPNAILSELQHHRDLGIHSGVIGDGIINLIESGVITNARKKRNRGISVTGGLFGTDRLARFAHKNQTIQVDPVSYTHSPFVLADFTAFTTINSAIEVDLFGQVNGEVANGKYVGTIGGQTDFVRGTQLSERGRSIVAMSARVSESGPSRIVPVLSSGIATAPRSDTDVVVTEYGVAKLKGCTVEDRAERLISVAHPDDREKLAHRWSETLAALCR